MRKLSFPHSVFKRPALQTRKNQGLFGKGLKQVVVAFPMALRITEVALRQGHQCQNNGLVKYWLDRVQETWICELSPFNIGLIHVFEVVNIRRGPKKWFNARVRSTRVLTILRASANVNDRENVN